MPPSITFWNRLEPRPRTASIAAGLAARVRDPAWMLARQWQLGEFNGQDAASPAYIQLDATLGSFTAWQPAGGPSQAFAGATPPPLEALVQSEPFTPDLSVRVELGQCFERLLGQVLPDPGTTIALVKHFRRSYPLPLLLGSGADRLFEVTEQLQPDLDRGAEPPATLVEAFALHDARLSPGSLVWVKEQGAEWTVTDDQDGQRYAVVGTAGAYTVYLLRDQEALRFLRVCAGRAIDGYRLHQAHQDQAGFTLPADLSAEERTAALAALDELALWVKELFGGLGLQDAAAWRPDQLEYEVAVQALALQKQQRLHLSAHPGRDGEFDWCDFDLLSETPVQPPPAPGESRRLEVLPMNVQFKGMPNARWWEFERNSTDFGLVQPDKRDLAKLLLMDFMLVHGNDWFVIPFDQPVGTLCWIDALLVHDVFGERTLVKRADTLDGSQPAGARWTLFSTARADTQAGVAPFFLLPWSAAGAVQTGPVLEEVRLLRDEMSNLVWAVEETTQDGLGQPWPGHERDLAGKPPITPSTNGGDEAPAPAVAALRYSLYTSVPVHWIPFAPVNIAPETGSYSLEIGALPDQWGQLIRPAGRILQPTNVPAQKVYRIREEEVSRAGTTILRLAGRTRWVDGSTHLWISRRKAAGTGEGFSGLRFDQAASKNA